MKPPAARADTREPGESRREQAGATALVPQGAGATPILSWQVFRLQADRIRLPIAALSGRDSGLQDADCGLFRRVEPMLPARHPLRRRVRGGFSPPSLFAGVSSGWLGTTESSQSISIRHQCNCVLVREGTLPRRPKSQRFRARARRCQCLISLTLPGGGTRFNTFTPQAAAPAVVIFPR